MNGKRTATSSPNIIMLVDQRRNWVMVTSIILMVNLKILDYIVDPFQPQKLRILPENRGEIIRYGFAMSVKDQLVTMSGVAQNH